MQEKSQQAIALHKKSCNCSQAVLLAFCEDYGLGFETASCLASGLGGGAKCAEICGAVSGGILVIGLKHGQKNSYYMKDTCSLKVDEFLKLFKEEHKYLTCRELLACDITTASGKEVIKKDNLHQKICRNLIASSARILQDLGY